MWRKTDPQGNESDKVKYDIVRFTRGRVLDIGCGPFKAFPHFIGVDNLHHAREFGWQMQPDIVGDAYDLSLFGDGAIDAVFSSHTLEHLENTKDALKEWWRVIKKGGFLVLYLPHAELYPKCGEDGSNPDHKHDFVPEDITAIMKSIGGTWDLVVNETREHDYGPGSVLNEYSFLQVYQKGGPGQRESWRRPRPAKTVAVMRYGGFGDMIQTSSILPGLKAQGYHVTMITTPIGEAMLKEDPHVDAFEVQDIDQVPNQDLEHFTKVLQRRFDKVINLSESVEGAMLALPGRAPRYWPKAARHAYMDHNYLEVTHGIAGVPLPPRAKFYPSNEEIEWARRERRAIGGSIVVMYSLSGSSVHKAWPHVDALFARLLLTYASIRIVTVGDTLAQVIEMAWEGESRVIRRAGVWNIRQTLTFALHETDLVIGPETGVLNAVGLEDVPKIVTLSHSSPHNLVKHWKNCAALVPVGLECYPCHLMHYSFADCNRDETVPPEWKDIPAWAFRQRVETLTRYVASAPTSEESEKRLDEIAKEASLTIREILGTGVAKCQAMISIDQMWEACTRFLPAPLARAEG